jgi:beta-mannosidase
VGRFNSEFGYQAYPDLSTLLAISPDLDDDVIQAHQKHNRGEALIQKHVNQYVCRDTARHVPTDEYVYQSQLSQAYGIGLAIEAQRAAKPRSMGTLYWQLNDAWPVISWSSIDYYGNKKLLHDELKVLYAPILIGVLPTTDGNFTVYAVSDLYREINAVLNLDIYDFDGELLKSFGAEVTIPENSSIKLPLDVNDFVKEFDKTDIYLKLQLIENESVIAERIQYLVYPKDLKLQE